MQNEPVDDFLNDRASNPWHSWFSWSL